MGVLHLPRIEMYWQIDDDLMRTPGISSIMSRIRFQQIFRFLHLADSSGQIPAGQPGHDKLYKVRKYVDLITCQFSANYTLHQPVTIDEAMIPFKGRLTFKQYMKNKPTKWGIKVFVLSDATNGYIYRIQIYSGKNLDCDVDVGLCSRVLLELMSDLHGHHLYTDNYYTSPEVFLALYDKGINCCGTVRVNRRGFPKQLVKKQKEDRGFYDYSSNGPLLAAVWYDRRYVYFLSTLHVGESRGATVRRKNLDGSSTDVPCPPLLPDYQQYMRGVDRGDQLIGCYNVGRRSKKWWKRVFAHLIECALLNAYILERYANPSLYSPSSRVKRDFLGFRIDVANQLIGSFHFRQRAGRPPSSEHRTEQRLNRQLDHWPIQETTKRECVVCSTKRAKQHLTRSQLRHESRFKCCYCNVHLCISTDRDCFKNYHTKVEYWK